jgi:hypothetical protein
MVEAIAKLHKVAALRPGQVPAVGLATWRRWGNCGDGQKWHLANNGGKNRLVFSIDTKVLLVTTEIKSNGLQDGLAVWIGSWDPFDITARLALAIWSAAVPGSVSITGVLKWQLLLTPISTH